MNRQTQQALIILATGLAVHEIFYWLKTSELLQIGGLALAAVGAGLYTKSVGRNPYWGLLAFFSNVGVLVLLLLVSDTRRTGVTPPDQVPGKY